MPGLHCTDCVFGEFSFNEEWGKYQGSCSRGYTLCDPHETREPDCHFCERPDGLVPTVDPFGNEYLRTENVCQQFAKPAQDKLNTPRRL